MIIILIYPAIFHKAVEGGYIAVFLDFDDGATECKSATVRKNVTIPSWLNEMGKSHNLNFSNLLQEAIKKELDIE